MKRILFVEDDLMIIRIYRGSFQSQGYEVEVATDGHAALECLKKNTPDVVVLDLQLPKVDGVEVLKQIRAQPATKQLPVIVFSNAFLGKLVEDAWKAGATKCLTKASCTPKQFLKILETTLGSAPSRTEAGAARSLPPGPASPDMIPATEALAQLAREANSWAAAVLPGAPPTLDRPSSPPESLAASRPVPPAPAASRAMRSITYSVEFQAQGVIRKIVLDTCPHTLTTLRADLLALMRKQNDGVCRPQLGDMFRAIHSLTGNAGLAGLNRIAQMSSALEALIQELDEKPKNLNASSLRTLAAGVDALGRLCETSADPLTDVWPAAVAFVVDDDPICCRAVCAALDKANLRSVSLDDPELALRVLERNRFDLIFMDIDMPKLPGFELATKLRAFEANRATPIVFVTNAASFESRASSMLKGGTDLIAKPFLLIELAVKALTYLVKASPKLVANPAASPAGTAS